MSLILADIVLYLLYLIKSIIIGSCLAFHEDEDN